MNIITKFDILIILIVLLVSLVYFWPRYVKLDLITTINNERITVNEENKDFNSELHWWFINSYVDSGSDISETYISPKSDLLITNAENLKNWGVDFDELGIDFANSNVILAFSREIKEMKFKRADWFPFHSISTVKTIMSKEFEPNTIFVYKIPKYDVREDLRAYTETTVEK